MLINLKNSAHIELQRATVNLTETTNTRPHSCPGWKLFPVDVTLTFVYYRQKQAKTEMYKVIMPILVHNQKTHCELAFTNSNQFYVLF